LSELSTTPNDADGELLFSITHPFHPLFGQQFSLLAQRYAWSEWRVFFHDPTTGHLRSLPTIWTNLAPPDPFVAFASGRAILRLTDLQALIRLLDDCEAALQEVP
jgi:hypothetical protein